MESINRLDMEITYIGHMDTRSHEVRMIVQKFDKGAVTVCSLPHVVYHSPTGLSAGYGGSGPADLALSILLDFLGETPTNAELLHGECLAWHLHQQFKWDFIAPIKDEEFEITGEDILAWLDQPKQRQLARAYED